MHKAVVNSKKKFLSISNSAAAVIILIMAASCDRALIETESAQGPTFVLENGCGIQKDIFFVRSFAAKISPDEAEASKLSHEEFMNYIRSRREEVDGLIEKAFANSSLREERFQNEASQFLNGYDSEDCIYLKLRIAEILESE